MTNLYMVMVGSGPMENELRDLIAECGLSQHVIRLGTLENSRLPALYNGALFGVISSREEGFGAVALEFNIMRKAVIAFAVGGLKESILDGFNGILIPSQNIDIMAEKMDYLLDNPKTSQQMGLNGHQRVLDHFTLSNTKNRYDELLRELIRPAKSKGN